MAGPTRTVARFEHSGLAILLVDDPSSFDRPGIYGPAPTVFTIHNALYSILGPLDETADLVRATLADREPGDPSSGTGRRTS